MKKETKNSTPNKNSSRRNSQNQNQQSIIYKLIIYYTKISFKNQNLYTKIN